MAHNKNAHEKIYVGRLTKASTGEYVEKRYSKARMLGLVLTLTGDAMEAHKAEEDTEKVNGYTTKLFDHRLTEFNLVVTNSQVAA